MRNSTALALLFALLPNWAMAQADLSSILKDINAIEFAQADTGTGTGKLADQSLTQPAPKTVSAPRSDTLKLPGPRLSEPVPGGYARLAEHARQLLLNWEQDPASPTTEGVK